MKVYSEEEKKALLNNYLNMYGDAYNENNIKSINKNFGTSYKDHMTQIYYALNLLSDEENPYVNFSDLIEKLYGLDLNILEVGGGVYPALSSEIAKRQQQIGKGTITVYDPYLSNHFYNKNIILNRKIFNDNVNIDSYDLIVGKEPCDATAELIGYSSYMKKELLVSPCKCYGLLPDEISFDDDPIKQWYDYVKDLMDGENKDSTLTYYLDGKTHYDNPIFQKVHKK